MARTRIRLHPERFDPLRSLAEWHDLLQTHPPVPAAEGHFIGRVRAVTAGGASLEALELEHYPGMTEAEIGRLVAAVTARLELAAVLVEHRVGRLLPGEPIVLVAAAADRRGAAQQGVRQLLEDLKHHAPFWKREWSGGSGRWLSENTPLSDR